MFRWYVERLEVVPLRFDLGAELYLVAERFQHCLDLALHLRQDMQMPATEGRPGERDVDRLGLGDVRQALVLELVTLGRERGLDGAFGLVGALAEGGTFGRRQLANA